MNQSSTKIRKQDDNDLTELFIERTISKKQIRRQSNDVGLVHALSHGVEGVVLRQLSRSIPKEIVMGAVGTDITNFSKLVKRKRLSSHQTEELNDLTLLWEELNNFFEGEKELINEWIRSPLLALEGETPQILMKSQYGRRVVRDLLEVMKYGDFA